MIPSVSQIAWNPNEEELARDLLLKADISHVELSPARIFEDSSRPSLREMKEVDSFWRSAGITPIAFQAILFGKPELLFFYSKELRDSTLNHIKTIVRTAGDLGIKSVVLGAPANRKIPHGMSDKQVQEISIDMFSELGDAAYNSGTALCIEPNPIKYGCNFITSSQEGVNLVRSVDSLGFKLHLDVACMWYSGEDVVKAIRNSQNLIGHFHVSAPELAMVPRIGLPYTESVEALKSIDYANFISLEMKAAKCLDANDFLQSLNYLTNLVSSN